MGSLLTSIGKILNLKFLLILLTIILFVDIYFTVQFSESFWDTYQKHIDLKQILLIIVLYLVTINIAVPMIALMFSVILFLLKLGIIFSNNDFLYKVFEFLYDNELQELEKIETRAIQENNSALIKSYELKLDDYKELHIIYLFSFFLSLEILFLLLNYDDFTKTFIYQVYNYLNIDEDKKDSISAIFLIYIPIFMLSLFSIRYITSFSSSKIDKWIKGLK